MSTGAAPLAELQSNYLRQQIALWMRMMGGAGSWVNDVSAGLSANRSRRVW